MQNIYLIGMMGSGKTSTGRALARLWGMKFIDLDEEIESRSHRSINEIFRELGEPYFRSEEKKALKEAAGGKETVVAPGGGIVLDPGNVATMKSTGKVIYLAASLETLWHRVRDKRDRPLLEVQDPKATFIQLFEERRPLYHSACDEKIETEGLSPEEAARKIAETVLK